MPKRSKKDADPKAGASGRIFRGKRSYLLALLAYAIISFAVFYPTSTHPFTNIPGGANSDSYGSVWKVWDVGHSVFVQHEGIWYTNLIFWPVGASLIFQNNVPIAALLVYPLTLVSLPFAYNVIFFAGMALSGLAMMLLAEYLVRNKFAAFIAGLIFAFGAFHIAVAYSDIQFAGLEWIPISIYLFLRILDRDYLKISHGKYLTVVALSASFVLMFYAGTVEQVIMAAMVFLIILLFYIMSGKHRAKVVNREFACLIALSVLLFFIMALWAIIPLATGFSAGGGINAVYAGDNIGTNMQFSDNILSYLIPSYYNGLFNRGGVPEFSYHWNVSLGTAYMGFTVLALAVLGLYKYRKKLYIWIIVCVLFFLLSLGPYILINRANTGIPGLYQLARYLPIVGLIREPGRFALMVSFALAIMASYGAKYIFEKIGLLKRNQALKLGVVALIAAMILIESSAPPLSAGFASQLTANLHVSNFYSWLGGQKGNFSVLELPILPDFQLSDAWFYPSKATLTTIFSGKPIIGGYTDREDQQEVVPQYNIPLVSQAASLESAGYASYYSPITENYTNVTIFFLQLYNVSFITLDKGAFGETALESETQYLAGVFGNPIYQDNSTIAFSAASVLERWPNHGLVAYLDIPYWNLTTYDGRGFAIPSGVNGNGSISVYAPYAQAAGGSSIAGQDIETAVSLTAVSVNHPFANLNISEGASNDISKIATLNVTGRAANYTFDMTLKPGNSENRLYFASGGNYMVGITNISFSTGNMPSYGR
jgi:hypothetical protein